MTESYRGISVITNITHLDDCFMCKVTKLACSIQRTSRSPKRKRMFRSCSNFCLLKDLANNKKQKIACNIRWNFLRLTTWQVLFKILQWLDCGGVMLFALIALYGNSDSMLGSVIISALIVVRHWSLSSCNLLIIYVNDLFKLLKDNYVSEVSSLASMCLY